MTTDERTTETAEQQFERERAARLAWEASPTGQAKLRQRAERAARIARGDTPEETAAMNARYRELDTAASAQDARDGDGYGL